MSKTFTKTKSNHNGFALTSPVAITCHVLPLLPPSTEPRTCSTEPRPGTLPWPELLLAANQAENFIV